MKTWKICGNWSTECLFSPFTHSHSFLRFVLAKVKAEKKVSHRKVEMQHNNFEFVILNRLDTMTSWLQFQEPQTGNWISKKRASVDQRTLVGCLNWNQFVGIDTFSYAGMILQTLEHELLRLFTSSKREECTTRPLEWWDSRENFLKKMKIPRNVVT